MKKISDIPELDRPREKLLRKGAEALSDLEMTMQLKSGGETLGIRLLDHIIFNQKDYYSFLENGDLTEAKS